MRLRTILAAQASLLTLVASGTRGMIPDPSPVLDALPAPVANLLGLTLAALVLASPFAAIRCREARRLPLPGYAGLLAVESVLVALGIVAILPGYQ